MNRQYAIDLPYLCLADGLGFSDADGDLLLLVIGALANDAHSTIMFRDNLWPHFNYSYDATSVIANILSQRETTPYPDDRKCDRITVSPQLLAAGITETLATELRHLLCFLHSNKRDGKETTYLIPSRRNVRGTQLTTTLDHKSDTNPMFVFSAAQEVDNLIKQSQPKLVQLKHKEYEQTFGENLVSAFTAYKDEAKARELLLQAYNDCKEPQGFPHYLFTYDKDNDTYVEFRHSNQGEYHGMDVVNDPQDREYQRMVKEQPYIIEQYRK